MRKEFYNSTETNYGDQVRVTMNMSDGHIGTDPGYKGDGVYLVISSAENVTRYGDAVLSAFEARKLATALNEAADYHEAKAAENAPKPKNFNEQTEHLGVGSLIAYSGNSWDTWLKVEEGWRGGAFTGNLWEPYDLDDPESWNLDNDFTVLYAAPKEN